MKAGAIFESILERSLYEPDGTIKPHFREFLRKQGRTEEEIAQHQRYMQQEIEDRKLFAPRNRAGSSLHDKIIARAGLDTEELLSQGYIAVEDLETEQDLDSFDWEDLL
ncbi:hypothetical protein PCC7424_2491 [Gloeothece citriformis PCC 7424]|uniref:Uncharacterized protein n=1 Tax=Gloeothece citriformis (strain PCC 7424) TaxID=65393 RepID=B7KK23_GLOC7|nr:hypothetical protein [Gloeothece citriformis]ACK70908.1 hypothetical protein PCC7424_2491 [Gloeothece citriformis PCC 7424]